MRSALINLIFGIVAVLAWGTLGAMLTVQYLMGMDVAPVIELLLEKVVNQ